MSDNHQMWLKGAEGWLNQPVPKNNIKESAREKRIEQNRSARSHNKSTKPNFAPNFEVIDAFKDVCVKSLGEGHSRRVVDTPDTSDLNQYRFALLREVHWCGLGQADHREQLRYFVENGYLEKRQDKTHGLRYRPTLTQYSTNS